MIANKQQYYSSLEKLGLSKSQIHVYLSCLELGEAAVGQIAKHAKTHRVNTYDIVNKLSEIGLLEKTNKKGKTFIRGTHPKNLLDFADQKRDDISKIKWKIADLVPELSALYATASGTRPKIRYYEGIQNYHKIQDETLNERELWTLGSYEDFFNVIDVEKEKKFIEERVSRQIPLKMILKAEDKKTQSFDFIWKDKEKQLREIRFIENFQFGLNGLMMISGNKVMWFNSKKELMIVVVESKEISDMQKNLFSMIWNNSLKGLQ